MSVMCRVMNMPLNCFSAKIRAAHEDKADSRTE